MSTITTPEIHEIVQRVVQHYLALTSTTPETAPKTEPAPAPAPVPAQPAVLPPADAGAAQLVTPQPTAVETSSPGPTAKGTVAIGADHGGYPLKEKLKKHLVELGYNVTDCGTQDTQAVDYPDFALAVARLISQAQAWRGIVIDGAGIGSCMTANKVPGVRAAMCYDYATAVNSREHNDANVLTLGAGLIGDNLAIQIVDTWLKSEFLGGRHARRVDKIVAIENQFLKK